MKRKQRILVSAYHEIGHYLLLKKFFKEFCINGVVNKIELCPKEYGRKGGRVQFSMNFDYEKASVEMIYGLISVDIAGFVAAKLACDFSYNSSDLEKHTDYISAYYYARKLSEILKGKSPEEILKECETEVKSYLMSKKYLLDEISTMLFKQRFLTKSDFEVLDNKYSL